MKKLKHVLNRVDELFKEDYKEEQYIIDERLAIQTEHYFKSYKLESVNQEPLWIEFERKLRTPAITIEEIRQSYIDYIVEKTLLKCEDYKRTTIKEYWESSSLESLRIRYSRLNKRD